MERENRPTVDGFCIAYPHIARFDWRNPGDLDAVIREDNAAASNPSMCAADLQIEKICWAYIKTSDAEREAYRNRVANGGSLWHFAHRVAIRAIRTGQVESIRLGLAALSLEDCRNDLRDTSRLLVMLLHAAEQIGADCEQEFAFGAAISTPRTAELMRVHGARGAAAYDPLQWFFRKAVNVNGPTFESLTVLEQSKEFERQARFDK